LQEEVTQKTIALSVNVGKGAARLTEQALQKAIKKFLEQKSKAPHGKQTMRQLMKQNAGVSNIEITDSNIKAFESTAKKYNICIDEQRPIQYGQTWGARALQHFNPRFQPAAGGFGFLYGYIRHAGGISCGYLRWRGRGRKPRHAALWRPDTIRKT